MNGPYILDLLVDFVIVIEVAKLPNNSTYLSLSVEYIDTM